MKAWVGTSGWQYSSWQGKFYPESLKSEEFLSFYCEHFNTVEINTSFYHLTKKSTFEKWYQKVQGKEFLFAVKLYRLFTHFRKLKLQKGDEKVLAQFLENCAALKESLGPILIQLPPSFKDQKALSKFLKKVKTFSKKIFKKMPRWAVEIRHPNLLNLSFYQILKKEKIVFVISDSPRWPTDFVKTTETVYIRFHGKPKLFASKYSKEQLKEFAQKLKKLKPKVLFAYFNNDFEGHALENAKEFKRLMG